MGWLDYHVFVHLPRATEAMLEELVWRVRALSQKVENIMADTAATLAALAAANASLDGIRQDIANLKAIIDAGGTPQEVADAVNALNARLAETDAENV